MEGLTWEEKYLRLRDDHTSLTHKANEQDDTIRRMNTKLSQIENSLKLKYRLDNNGGHEHDGGGGAASGGGSGGTKGGGLGHPRNRENEQLVEELHRYNRTLLRENGDLKTKIKSLNDALSKKKKELITARLARTRAMGAGPAGPRSPCPAARATGMRTRHVQLAKKRSADDMDMGATNRREDRKLSELVDKLRQRVTNAEEQLKGVRAENQRLRQDKLDAGCAPEDAHEQAMAAAAAARRELPGRNQEEVENLHRELREAQAKAQLIQARFDHLEARTLAQADLHEGSVDKLQETNRQLRDVRRELQDVLHERDVAVTRSGRVDDLEETVDELRKQNKELENQVTRLCENPFISQAFRDQERSERLLELEQRSRADQLKIDHLQETAQTHHAALVTLKKQTVRLREDKDRAERALQEMRVRHNETEAGAQLMADKMRLYAGDEDVDLEELERALTIVRRKMADPAASLPGFLSNAEDEEMNNVPALRRKLQRVQVSNLNLTRELERAERMLKAQMSINRDLHVELEEACRRATLDRGELGQKLRDFEALALERLTVVHRLEAQIKQLLYGPARRKRLGAGDDISAAKMEEEQESALLNELAEGDFSADQNIVEVWVVGAELEPGVLSAGSSSFIVVDFFDFESQATPLLPGVSPAYDFATTFKVTVDDFFLRYLGTEGLVLELNQARAADFELVGRRQVALAGLLSSKPRIILQREPLISTRDGAVVGYVHVEIRMALPVTELYALFLERRPEEKERVEQARLLEAKAHGYLTPADGTGRTSDSTIHGGLRLAGREDTTRLRNELEVVVVGCRGLPSRGGAGKDNVAPAAYVHYQLLGFQDVFTPVVHGVRDPSFRHSTSFPVATDDKLLRFLGRHRLAVTVMDDLANNDTDESGQNDRRDHPNGSEGDAWPADDESEGLIGEALIDLSPLAEGRPVLAEWATVEDATGRPAGTISVSARWLKPLRTGGDPGPHGLSSEEVEGLMARFSPEKDGQVNYVAFLRESDPPPAVLAALAQIHSFLAQAAEQDGLSATEALGAVLGVEGSDPKAKLPEETFVSALLSSGRVRASPDELAAAYRYATGGGGGSGDADTDCRHPLTLGHLAAFATYGSDVGGGSAQVADDRDGTGASISRGGGGRSDWSSWVGVARPGDGGPAARRALVKARVKCRDAGLLGRSFPGEAFSRLDPEGAGRVSRPAFKRALREMGFALVDETPEDNSEGLVGGDEQWRMLKDEGRAVGKGRGGGLGSILEEAQVAGHDDDEVRLRRAEREEHEEAKITAFREKIKDIERSTAEKLDEAGATYDGSSSGVPRAEGVEPSVAHLDGDRSDAGGDGNGTGQALPHQHLSSTVVRDSYARVGPAKRLEPEAAASLVQSRFRGYRTRKGFVSNASGGGPGPTAGGKGVVNGGGEWQGGMVAEQVGGVAVGGSGGGGDAGGSAGEYSLLDLEDAIEYAYGRCEGTCSPPDLCAAFAKLDKASTGFLDRARFALALRGVRPSLELSPELLRVAMDSFDDAIAGERDGAGEEGASSRTDYRAFTIFCEERRHPEVSPAVALLRQKPMRPGARDVFARRDPLGTGFVCRVDLFDGLRELGVSGVPPAQLQHLATLFEEAEDMVDYESLVAFASEQPVSLRATRAVSRLRGHLLALRNGKGLDLRATLEAFAVGSGGVGGGGGRRVLRQPQLEDALRELGFSCTDDEKRMVYNRLNPSGDEGISPADLAGFVEGTNDYDTVGTAVVGDPNLVNAVTATLQDEERGVGKLLRRAQSTVVEAAQRMDSDFEGFDRPYLCYDWRRTGRVGTAEFVRSTIRCGFPFTRAQAAFLAGVFGDGRDVSYPTFLSWATPGPDGLAASGVHPHGITHVPGPSSRRQHQHPRRGPAEGALYALEGGGGKEPRNWKQLQQSDGGIRERRTGVEGEEEREREEEAELKVRTALQRMGEDGISRAWEEFENMDPGGRRGGVQEEELVEVLATLGLPVTAKDVSSLMRRFAAGNSSRSKSFFLYPRLLESITTGGREGRLNPGRPQDVLRNIRTELRRLVRRTNVTRGGTGSGDDRPTAALRAFESLDRSGTGRVSRRDFRRALRELGFDRLGDDEAADILDHFDPHGDGSIRYADFLREIETEEGADEDAIGWSRLRVPSPRGCNGGGGSRGEASSSEKGRLMASLKRAIDRGIDYRREMELEEAGGSSAVAAGRELLEGVVSRESFRRVMKRIKADLSEGELKDLEKRFAAPSSAYGGSISGVTGGGRGGRAGPTTAGVRYVELMHWGATHRESSDGDDETWAVAERLRQMIRRRFNIWMPGTLKKAFRHFDARRKGQVSEADLSDGLGRLGLDLTTREERALLKAMDLDGQGFLVYPDLVVFARDPNHHNVRDKILGQLARVTESRLREELERKDPSGSGMVSEKALGKILEKFGADPAGADLGRLMYRFDAHEDGNASIERVVSFCQLCGSVRGGDGNNRRSNGGRLQGRYHAYGRGGDDGGDEGDEILQDARDKLREGLGLGGTSAVEQKLSPRRLFQYLDTDGAGEIDETDFRKGLEAHGVKLTKRETRLLVADMGGGSTKAGLTSSGITFPQFAVMLEKCGHPETARTTATRGGRDFYTTPASSWGHRSPVRPPRSSSGKRKEVTFRDEDGSSHHHHPNNEPLLRTSLRRLMVSSSSNENNPTASGAAGTGGVGNAVGPGLRDRLRGALQTAAETRGARRGSAYVDRETVRRAMIACAAPLDSQLLGDLERRLDRRGTGEINVEEFVKYIADVVEADVWERVATEMAGTHPWGTRSSTAAGVRFIRGFISDLSQFVDGREEISRRELRKALERNGGVTTLREEEILVLCDSLDPKRRGTVHLSDVRDSLSRGLVVGPSNSEFEDGSDDEGSSSIDSESAAAAETVLSDLRLLVRAAERERGVDLLESFEHFDRRGQGEVSEDEFWEGLQSLGLGQNLSRSHASRVVESFKGRKHGRVRYRDFVQAMEGGQYSPRGGGGDHGASAGRRRGPRTGLSRRQSSTDDIERLVDRLKEEIGRLTEEEDGPPPFRQIFEAADHRGTGTLPSLAFRRCLLEGLGFDLTEIECETLLEYLDTGRDNNISYREFLQFVGHEVRERTPPRSRSPRRGGTGGFAAHSTRAEVGGGRGGGDLVHSPPRQRQYTASPRRRSSGRSNR